MERDQLTPRPCNRRRILRAMTIVVDWESNDIFGGFNWAPYIIFQIILICKDCNIRHDVVHTIFVLSTMFTIISMVCVLCICMNFYVKILQYHRLLQDPMESEHCTSGNKIFPDSSKREGNILKVARCEPIIVGFGWATIIFPIRSNHRGNIIVSWWDSYPSKLQWYPLKWHSCVTHELNRKLFPILTDATDLALKHLKSVFSPIWIVQHKH